jgi:hypothetical protein
MATEYTANTEPTAEASAEFLAHIEEQTRIPDWVPYNQRREAEYPPLFEYIDGVVKGDQAQIDAYIAACIAVKNKYPKDMYPLPEE